MAKNDDHNLLKLRFAVLYFKLGKNATAAAKELGKSRTWGYRLKSDPLVKEYIKELVSALSIDKLAQADKDRIGKDIADINEILQILTKIARGERSEEMVIVVKEETTGWNGKQKTTTRREVPKIVNVAAKNADIVRASAELMKYLTVNGDDSEGEPGVILLPEVKI